LNSIEKSRFYISEQYIQASKNLIDGMLETNNISVIISDHPITSDEMINGLKNSSGSIILPALFCLYQGIELLLKGFVNIKSQKNNGHEAEALCKQFSEFYQDEEELISLFNKFIFSPRTFINQYKLANNLNSIRLFYNSLRYPERKDGSLTNYYQLKHPDNEDFLPQLVDINNDINKLLLLSVKLFRKLDDQK